MTLVHISYEHPDGIGLTPSEGYLEWFPTKRRNDAATVILPESFTTVLAAGITTVEIAPTEPSWAWVVYERVPGGSSRCVAVADVTEVNYTDLIDVDPGTLTPTAAPEAAWWAAIGASVQGAAVVGNDLILTRRDGTTFDAGQVVGTAGTDASALVTGTLADARLPVTAQAATLAATYETQTASAAALSGHTSNVSNPHSVTKAQVGLGSADNTSDADKPVSTAQAAALALKANAAGTEAALGLKAPLDSPAFTGTVTGVTKANVGLGSVDNTSDALKPLSDAATTALGAKQDKATLDADVATDAGTAGTALNTALTADFAPIAGSANYSGSPAGTAGKPLAATDTTTTNARTPTAHKTSHGLGGTDPVLLDATQVTTGTLADARLPTTAQAATLAATYAPITGSANYLAPTALDAAQAANINTPASASATALNAAYAPISTVAQISTMETDITGKVDKGSIVLNVRDYGAKGDGFTDDTAAIQASVNAGGDYGNIYLPAGTYVISAPITVSAQYVTIRGAGYRSSRLYLANNSNSSMLVTADDGTQRYGLLVSDLSFAGNASNQTSLAPAINIRGMNESRIEGIYILEPSGDGIHVGQTTAGMYSTVPMINRAIIRGNTSSSMGNGINLDAGSSDAQVSGCDIGLFTVGAGIALSGHNGYELVGNMSWQNQRGYNVYASNRGRIAGCLSDYAKQHGFSVQNSNDTQLVGCQSRESSITTANTYDGFYIEGTASANTCYSTILTGCRAMGSQQRYGANLDQYVSQVQISGCDWQGNSVGGIRTGTVGVFGVSRWDSTPLVTDGTGATLFGYDSAGRPIYSQFSATATAGASGAVPAQVQGYLNINIEGGFYRVPYFNA